MVRRGRRTRDDVRRGERLEEEGVAVDEEARVAEDALALGRAQRADVDGFGGARPRLGVRGVRDERLVAAARRGAPGFVEQPTHVRVGHDGDAAATRRREGRAAASEDAGDARMCATKDRRARTDAEHGGAEGVRARARRCATRDRRSKARPRRGVRGLRGKPSKRPRAISKSPRHSVVEESTVRDSSFRPDARRSVIGWDARQLRISSAPVRMNASSRRVSRIG